MTVTTDPDDLERYGRQSAADGRHADAAAAFAEAAQNRARRGFTPVDISKAAADQALSQTYSDGSHLAAGAFVRNWSVMAGWGSFSAANATLLAAGVASLAGGGSFSGRPTQKMVGGNSASFAGAGRFISTV
jgi:hypothetical protein